MSDIYDYEYDDRTWAEKYRDDNTWQRDTGLVEYDGVPFYMWCQECNKPVRIHNIEGRNVFDSYIYEICAECNGTKLRQVTVEEAHEHNVQGDIQ
jgi:hypothetical protein